MTSWWMVATVAVLGAYEVGLLVAQRLRPQSMSRAMHGLLRTEWAEVLGEHAGTEVLAVQTLRNAVMSSTMVASTAAIALIGAANLSAPSFRASLGNVGLEFSARLMLELVVLALLFVSLVSTVLAVRSYNHASFIVSMPVGSSARRRWMPTASDHLRRAGALYGVGLHHLVLVAPVLVAIVYPAAGPFAAVAVVVVLSRFDRLDAASLPAVVTTAAQAHTAP
jgi:hypothetical protein